MDWRILGFVLSAILLGARLVVDLRRKRSNQPSITVPGHASWWQLVLASFLTLFAELTLIRWISTEVRVFAYVKNLALLLCFLGFGLGCALARRRPRWWSSAMALLGLIMVVRLPWHGDSIFENLSQALGGAQDIQIWAVDSARNWPNFLVAAAITGVLLLLIAYVFVPFGQCVSEQLDLAPRPLQAYSWNLVGSIAGILAFFAVCWLASPPGLWMAIVFAGVALLQRPLRRGWLVAALSVPAALMLHDVATPAHFITWTPYQQIEYRRRDFPGGEMAGALVTVNHTGYQWIVNLSPEFLARHPALLAEPLEQNPYNVPFSFAAPKPRVLIVGSGAGNDVAGAVRHQSRAVDAVEIDPGILALGRNHPEHPYSAPDVSVHLTDARAYMKRAHGPYDLVIFGLLDSHTQFSDYSNVRIDNFVYTKESFEEAKALLSPDGVLFIKFQVNRDWLGRRLEEMLVSVFGKEPVMFWANSSYTAAAACFVISPSGRVEQVLAADPALAEMVARNPVKFTSRPDVPITTDDWPYLYQEGRWLPGIFVAMGVVVLLLAAALYWQIPEARVQRPSLFFFSMGAGFLLLETQVISRLALYFGTTWQVNGIVIGAILATLLLANAGIENIARPWPSWWSAAGICAGIVLVYLVPFHRIAGSATFVGSVAAGVFMIPVFFAGLLFAAEFRITASPSAALGANILGAVIGGLLENLSLVTGMRSLLLIALLLYLLAAASLKGNSRARRTSAADFAAAGGGGA